VFTSCAQCLTWAEQEGSAPPQLTTRGILKPGEGWLRDYRPAALEPLKSSAEDKPAVRLLSWNIHRGYKIPESIKFLREQNADVILLQEVDIGCRRTECSDGVKEIGRALQLNTFFACVFEELASENRHPVDQGVRVDVHPLLLTCQVAVFKGLRC